MKKYKIQIQLKNKQKTNQNKYIKNYKFKNLIKLNFYYNINNNNK